DGGLRASGDLRDPSVADVPGDRRQRRRVAVDGVEDEEPARAVRRVAPDTRSRRERAEVAGNCRPGLVRNRADVAADAAGRYLHPEVRAVRGGDVETAGGPDSRLRAPTELEEPLDGETGCVRGERKRVGSQREVPRAVVEARAEAGLGVRRRRPELEDDVGAPDGGRRHSRQILTLPRGLREQDRDLAAYRLRRGCERLDDRGVDTGLRQHENLLARLDVAEPDAVLRSDQ